MSMSTPRARGTNTRTSISITRACAAPLAVAILSIIQAAPLSETVKQRAGRAFQLLGEAEAAIHSIPIEKVHFHEVGAVDTIVDIVCAAAGCEALGVDRWLSSPLNVGSGTVKCQHGTLACAGAGHAGAAGRCASVCGRRLRWSA